MRCEFITLFLLWKACEKMSVFDVLFCLVLAHFQLKKTIDTTINQSLTHAGESNQRHRQEFEHLKPLVHGCESRKEWKFIVRIHLKHRSFYLLVYMSDAWSGVFVSSTRFHDSTHSTQLFECNEELAHLLSAQVTSTWSRAQHSANFTDQVFLFCVSMRGRAL